METVGKFEFSRKDLIGHGAFAVVFKGRHKEKPDWEVAVKCINKKNLAKSQTLLGKEIKILKELKHENIVALYDFQEMASCVYLVMEYCNGGDLADYLHSKGTLSEDTIRLFLHQIAGAMKVLQSKGIIHRDLKPQNILLSHSGGRKSSPGNTCIKIADFGFARYLQTNMMAATLCGSPMYMAPEVIMSQSYDAKADLWSIGTIVFQCLTGKAPFQASSPQDLRLFYEKNKNLTPNIPRETSTHLRHLLSGLLKRNHKDRMDFDEFFRHPFLEVSSSMKKSAPVPMPSYPSSGSASSCSSSSTSHLASPPQSVAEMQQLRAKTLASPTQDSPGFLHGLKDSAGSSKDSSCDMEDFVMVPVQFSSDIASEATGEKPVLDSLMCSGSSLLISAGLGSQGKTPSPSPSFSNSPSPSGRPIEFSASNYGQSVPIPVPTQIHNYQRMEQNLHCPSQHVSPRSGPPVRKSSSASPLGFGRSGTSPPFPGDHGTAFSSRRLSAGGSKPYQPSPQVGTIPEVPGQTFPLGSETRSRLQGGGLTVPEHLPRHGMGSRLHSAPNLSEGGANFCRQKIKKQHSDPVVHRQCSQPQQVPSLQPGRQLRSSPKLSELVHRSPLPTILGSPTKAMPPFEFPKPPSSQNLVTLLAQQGLVLTPTRNRTIPDLKELGQPFCQQTGPSMRPVEENKGAFGRSLSAGRLSEMLLKAAFGGQVLDSGSRESLNTERPMDTAPPSGDGAELHSGVMVVGSGCPAPVVFTVGSPPSGSTPPQTNRTRMFSVGSSSSLSSGGSFSGRQFLTGTCADGCEGPSSLRYGFSDPVAASLEGGVTFEAPELPEETLMEQEHTETLRSLRFTLAFVHCVMEIAATKGMVTEGGSSVTSSFQLQESMVADQISLLSREWSYAEQLVLYMKTTELLSASLHTAMESIKQGKLCPSTTVKQVIKKLNELYKSSVSSCRSLNARLQRFFYDKQKLMDRINSITADKLIYNHTVHMIQSAALDEMFHHGEASVQRYHKALLLMEGLSLIINEQADVENISKCKLCIERRLSALQSGLSA
ncbi:serine/threonine-protein kinase ULK1-like isoform X1 [Acipenser ruthenus]|uniref:serine/threonine-protein kinase ULK1-like isoform X1 n=1 Tax=Acipenser ruthenus TaxID=7906 RepID=UPI002741875E|nr:serine/threonine-protein kinase ULK1-like isoform X1 [Acipenser ruthenus]